MNAWVVVAWGGGVIWTTRWQRGRITGYHRSMREGETPSVSSRNLLIQSHHLYYLLHIILDPSIFSDVCRTGQDRI